MFAWEKTKEILRISGVEHVHYTVQGWDSSTIRGEGTLTLLDRHLEVRRALFTFDPNDPANEDDPRPVFTLRVGYCWITSFSIGSAGARIEVVEPNPYEDED